MPADANLKARNVGNREGVLYDPESRIFIIDS